MVRLNKVRYFPFFPFFSFRELSGLTSSLMLTKRSAASRSEVEEEEEGQKIGVYMKRRQVK